MRSFFFLDANNGFAVGDGSLFLVTKDGGATWTPKDIGIPPTNLRSISCATLTLCVMTTEPGTALVRTDDGGATATARHALAGPDLRRGLRLGDAHRRGRRHRRHGGLRRRGAELRPDRRAPERDATRGCAPAASRARPSRPGDNGSLAKTIDGGKTWTRGNVATSEDVVDVAFPTALVGYALDSSGGLFRTNDGGATWKTLDTGTTARPFQLAAPTTSTVILAGPTGLRRSTDSGDTFSTVKGKDVVEGQARRDRPRRQRALRLGLARPAALDRPRQDVEGAAQADA